MAGTIGTGNISTEEVLPDERVVDMADRIRKLDTDDAQFTTMTDRVSNRTAIREKVNWLEEEDFPRQVTVTTAQLAGDTSMTVAAGQGKIVQANDLLRNMRSGEAVRITAVATDVLTIQRGVGAGAGAAAGAVAAAAINANDVFLVVSDTQPQGSDFPTARYLARVLGFNYTQITRTPWTFTGTQTAIELYGGREPAKEATRKGREHKRKWEAIGFFGARSFIASSTTPTTDGGEPKGSAGGAIEFIGTNVLDCAGAAMDPKAFDKFVAGVFAHGSSDSKVLFAAPVLGMCMSNWNRTGMGAAWDPSPRNVYGVKVDAFISGAYGYRIPVIVKKEWSGFPVPTSPTSGGYGGIGFLLDMDYIQQIPLRDRDTKLLTEQQPKGKDTYAAEYFREATYEFAHERVHGKIIGCVAP